MAFGFFTPEEVGSPAQMALRQRIALQMLANAKRSGYPKNVGEGLTAIGDAIGERSQIATLEGQMKAYEDAKKAEKAASDVDTPTPGRRAEADPQVRVATADDVPLAREIPQPPAEPVIQPTPPPVVQAAQPPPTQPTIATSLVGRVDPNVERRAPGSFPGPDTQTPGIPASMVSQLGPAGNVNTSSAGGRVRGMLDDAIGANALYRPATLGPRSEMAGPVGPMNNAQSSQMAELMGGPPRPQASPYGATASLRGAGGTMSDADPVEQTRNAITQRLLAPAQGVPQPNPMQPAASQPPTSPPLDTASLTSPPEAAGNRPIVMPDVQPQPAAPVPAPGAQLAQNGGGYGGPNLGPLQRQQPTQVPAPSPAPLPNLTPAPLQQAPDPTRYDKLDEPKLPTRVLPSAQQLEMERKARDTEDADMKAYYSDKAAKFEAARAAEDARNKEIYEKKYNLHTQQQIARDAAMRGLEKHQAETTSAQAAASVAADQATISSRAGGVDPATVVKDFQSRAATAKANVDMLRQAKIAQEAINNGIVSGVGANMKLDMARLQAWAFKNKFAGDLATQSQVFQSAVASMLGGGVQAIQPHGGPTSETDMKIATGIVGASPQLQEEAKRRILNNAIEKLHGDINDYEEKKNKVFGGLKADSYFDVRTDPVHEDPALASKYVERLLEKADSKAVRDRFDELFGKGAAQLEIDRAARAKRYPRAP